MVIEKVFNYKDYEGSDGAWNSISRMSYAMKKVVLDQKQGSIFIENRFKFTVNFNGLAPRDPAYNDNGSYIGYALVAFDDLAVQNIVMEVTINCPDTWDNINDISQLYMPLNNAFIVHINAKNVKVIDGLLGMAIGSNNTIPILDLSGVTGCTELHHLYRPHTGATANIIYNDVEHIIYPPTEDIVSVTQWFDLNLHTSYPPRISVSMIQEFFSYPWPKLKDISNFIYFPKDGLCRSTDLYPNRLGELLKIGVRYPYTDADYPMEYNKNDESTGPIFDFKNLTALENVYHFISNDYYQAPSFPIYNLCIKNISGPKGKPLNIEFLIQWMKSGNEANPELYSVSCGNCVNGSRLRVRNFINLYGQEGYAGPQPTTVDTKVLYGYATANAASFYLWNQKSVVINTGNTAIDNEVKKRLPEATIGFPPGWTHIFAAT